MNERQKRLNEVYEHLRKFYGIHTQSDFANALRKSRNAITLALNGDEKYLTNKLFKNICEAYKGVFNLDYLLNGTGDLLTPQEDVKSSEIEQAVMPSHDESLANLLELYAQRIRLVDDLRQSLKEELAEVRAIKEDMQTAVNDFRDATYRLNMALKSLNEQRPLSIGIAADEGDY
jgi:transcriptional regulator with XRE-family HTH domain